jgi:hypothetical protein
MKVIISLTSVPPRFKYLPAILERLEHQMCHEIWVNIPRTYKRFPDWDGSFDFKFSSKIVVNRDCEDLGPGTKMFGPLKFLEPGDIIVYLDDDTNYDPKLVTNLMKWWRTDQKSAWGLSGFNFENYFKGEYPRQHGVPLDVLEGYGAVLVKTEWLRLVETEFKELTELTWHDDMILCNLFAKHGIARKTVHTPTCHIGQVQQFNFGFEEDALHHVAGGSHTSNNKKILELFELKNKNYYNYKP